MHIFIIFFIIIQGMNLLTNLCCWGTDYCKCQFLGLSRNQNIKLSYILIISLMILLTGLIGKLNSNSQSLNQIFLCDNNSAFPQKQAQCVQEQLSFRWFLSLSFMHLLLITFVILRSQMSKIFNEGAWFIKFIYIIGLGFIFMYAMPHGFVYALQVGSAYLVPVWYLIQNLIIIDMIYSIENSLKQLAQNNAKFHIVKAMIAIFTIIGAVIFNVLSYVHHPETTSVYISILNSIYIVVFLVIVLLRLIKGHSLLVYGFVMLYSNFVAYYLHCSADQYSETIYPTFQIIFIVICLLVILSPGSNKIRTKKSSLNEYLSLNTCRQQEDNRYVSSNKWLVFHFVFFLICFILPWVLNQSGQAFPYQENLTNEWAKLFRFYRILGWFLIIIIYIWTLVAARLYPDQDFDELENYFKEFELN